MTVRVALCLCLLWLSCSSAFAWLRELVFDDQLVARSELIVIGRLDPASLKCVQFPRDPEDGDCMPPWEEHGTLIVSEVLAGQDEGRELPVIIHYGLGVRIGGFEEYPLGPRDRRGGKADYAEDLIEIGDTGSSAIDPMRGSLVPNAAGDNLWFLRRLHGPAGREPGGTTLGIATPEDLQPLWLKPYFAALIAGDVDARLPSLLADADSRVRLRAVELVARLHRPEHLELLRSLLGDPDPQVPPAAAAAMAEIGGSTTLPVWRELIGHGDPRVVNTAFAFLCRFGDTASTAALLKAAEAAEHEPDAAARVYSLASLGSTEAVPLLLKALDWEPAPGPPSLGRSAAEALHSLTGIRFPQDTAQATAIWERVKDLAPALLLRKTMLLDIQRLSADEAEEPWVPYRRLVRLANQDLCYEGTHSSWTNWGQVRRRWQDWFETNAARSRLDWVCEGFAASGIVLPRPMTREGIDLLIDVVNWNQTAEGRGWLSDCAYGKREPFIANANWLLEHYTGATQGITSDGLGAVWRQARGEDVLGQRWRRWWQRNRDTLQLRADPVEAPVTLAGIRAAPDLTLPPPPLELTISLAKRQLARNEEVAIEYRLTNTCTAPVTITSRPWLVSVQSIEDGGQYGYREGAGNAREDFVTIAPGESLAFEDKRASLAYQLGQGTCRARAQYIAMGRAFGLHAWRGTLVSNGVAYRVMAGP